MATDFSIRHAVHCVRSGGVIIYPTETVYGLGCDPDNANAVARLNELKQRDAGKGLILLASNIEQLEPYVGKLGQTERDAILQTQKPTSWIIPVHANAPAWITGKHNSIVVRISPHPVVGALCNALKHPLVSSSANPSGKRPALNALQLHTYFYGQADAILTSQYPCSGRASTILELKTMNIVRH